MRQHHTTDGPNTHSIHDGSHGKPDKHDEGSKSFHKEINDVKGQDYQKAIQEMKPGNFGKSTTDFLPKLPIDF